MSSGPPRLTPGEVRIACFDADASGGIDAGVWAELTSWLRADERARFNRFRSLDSRASFLIGRGLARRMLADATGEPPEAFSFVEGPRGRPEIGSPATSLRFNVAHSGGMVACALTDGRDVGVDVEQIDRRALTPGLAARCCSPAELADIDAEPEWTRQQRFLAYWTLKEAYLKARGLGISVPLADVSFALDADAPRLVLRGTLAGEDPAWVFRLAQPGARHLVAACVHDGDPAPSFAFTRFGARQFSGDRT